MRKHAGFTLLELLVTLTVAGVLTAIAVPNFKTTFENNHLVAESNDLLSALLYARTEAINQGATQATLNHLTTIQPVQVCASSDGQTCNSTNWANGWIVYGYTSAPSGSTSDLGSSAAGMLRSYPALPSGTSLDASNITTTGSIAFNTDGTLAGGAATIPYFFLCDSRGSKYGRAVYLGASGEARVATTPGYELNPISANAIPTGC